MVLNHVMTKCGNATKATLPLLTLKEFTHKPLRDNRFSIYYMCINTGHSIEDGQDLSQSKQFGIIIHMYAKLIIVIKHSMILSKLFLLLMLLLF